MKPVKEGYRIAVVGAASLVGKELMSILEQGKFPVSRLAGSTGVSAGPPSRFAVHRFASRVEP